MKIALLGSASSIHIIRWANSLAKAGIEVYLISQHMPTESLDPSIKIKTFPDRGVLGYFLMVPAVTRILKSFQPDVLSAHYASGYATTARLTGYHPWMLSVWGSDVYEVPNKSPLHRLWIRKNIEGADLVASTSHCMAEQTLKIAPSLSNIEITPFGVDTNIFAQTEIEKTTSASTPSLIIGTVKTLAHKYGIDTLIEAYAKLRNNLKTSHPNILEQLSLRIVGDGPDKNALEKLTLELGVSDTVSFVGRVPYHQVPDELKNLDIYVALSRLDSESFGVAVIEASAAGRPCIVSNVGGLPEVVDDGKTGFIVPREDSDSAAMALEKLVLSSALRSRMGDAGYHHVSKNYEWSTCVQTMIKALNKTQEKNNGKFIFYT